MVSLSRGLKVCLTLAALLFAAAAFSLFVGLQKPGQEGFPFLCGSALHPPTDDFPKSVCGYLNRNQQLKVGWLASSGLIVAVGGFASFGVSRRTEVERAH
ncbi:hypothetical protein EAH86_05250 [Pedococcus bigeumensis]|uniref:Uncharacterized protein n=1 Tax=Pedococcus bigeumensis TaxID=433644 RepID=A0A502CYU1_9MICO|nr:hypothetical protein EAH86_05250 [Pedococcus bigeumensis]